MGPELSNEAREQIEAAMAGGHKIMAIKLYREATGLGLAEAKTAVEAMEARPEGPVSTPKIEQVKQTPPTPSSSSSALVGGMTLIVALTIIVLGVKVLMEFNSDDNALARYSDAFSIALVVWLTLLGSSLAHRPDRKTRAFLLLAIGLFLMFAKIYVALDS